MMPRGASLHFRSAVLARGARSSEPSEDAPDRPAVMPAETIPDSWRRIRERAELRAFCLFLLAVLVIGNVGFWFALALLPTPTPAPVVASSLPAVFLAALASSSTPAPEPSAAPAVTSSAASLAASAAPVVALVPFHSAAPRVRAPASAGVPHPPRPTSTSGIVDPWGGDQ